jgi:hypothetical protein
MCEDCILSGNLCGSCYDDLRNKEADLKLINDRRINPKGVRGQ